MAAKKCRKGSACGNSCQARSRNCASKAEGSASALVDYYEQTLRESNMLAKGYFGEVYKTPQGTLMKKAFADAPPERQIQQSEIDIQRLMGEQGHSPKILGQGTDSAGNKLLEMEFLDGYKASSLSGTGYHDGALTRNQGKKIEEAISFMHKSGYAHDDIHALNVMTNADTDDAKLIDFGKSFKIDAKQESHRRALYRDLVKAASTLKLNFEPESAQAKALVKIQEAKNMHKKGKALDAALDEAIKQYLEGLK